VAKRNLARFSALDTTFSSTREAKFINALLEVIQGGDEQQFTAVVVEFDQVTKLDNWKTNILLKIKKTIDDEPDMR
jgi:alpha-soluble NSF attachment protein